MNQSARFGGAVDLCDKTLGSPPLYSTACSTDGELHPKPQMKPSRSVIVNGKISFSVPDGEIILDAALSQGIPLPHQCRGASCGTCKARVLEGSVDNGWSFGLAISDEELKEGFCLLCQARPTTELVRVETVRPMEEMASSKVVAFDAQVVRNEAISPRVRHLVLRAPEASGFAAKAGSYVEVGIPGVVSNRKYSVATVPREGLIELLVSRHPQGKASGYIHEALAEGDYVRVSGPFGTCCMPAGTGPVLGLAGGTGLAPVISIMEAALREGDKSAMRLMLSVREDEELIFVRRLARLKEEHLNFDFYLLVTDCPSQFCAKQQFAPSWLRDEYQTLDGWRAVIGGSPGFVHACTDVCRSLGMRADDISSDSFESVPIS